MILICILLNCFIYSEYYYKEWLDDYFYTPYKLFHSKDLLSHICKVLVPFMVFSRCEAPVNEGKSISKNNIDHQNVSHDEIKKHVEYHG